MYLVFILKPSAFEAKAESRPVPVLLGLLSIFSYCICRGDDRWNLPDFTRYLRSRPLKAELLCWKPIPNVIEECFAICLIYMFIDWTPFSSSSVLMVAMHMVAFVQMSLPADFVASKQKHPNTIQLSRHIGASGNANKNNRRVKLMHLLWECNLLIANLFFLFNSTGTLVKACRQLIPQIYSQPSPTCS